MKKTLFLALVFGLAGLSQATVVETTGVVVSSPTSLPVTGALSIGTSNAAGSVTVNDGVTFDLPGALFIGGSGNYSGAPNTSGNDGELTLGNGATLTVGTQDTTGTAVQSHINVGNSKFDNVVGTLNINGATVSAEQVVVGQENGGVGHIVIADNGSMTLLNTQGTLDAFHGLLIRNGDVTVKDTATLNNTVADTLIGTDSNASLNLQDNATADFFTVLVGAADSATSGAINISGGAAMSVAADLFVEETGSVTVSGTGSALDADAIWVDNSEVTVKEGATADIAYMELTGDDASVTVDASVMNVAEAVFMNKNTAMSVVGGGAMNAVPYMELAAGANIDMSGNSHITADEIHFTVTNDNYSSGQIHLHDTTSSVTVPDVTVTIDGSLLDALTSGQEEIVLVSTEAASGTQTDPLSVTWIVNDRDITYTVDGMQDGLVLNLYQTDPLNPEQKPGDLVDDIINTLVSPTAVAAINTLNGTVSALNGLFNVVKSQLEMPHNVDMPVGNVAEDSRLAYTGRYFVGANRAWVSALGASDRVATDIKGEGYHYNGGGYAVGYDRVITPQMYVGAAVGQMIGKYKANNELVRDSQMTYEGTLYSHYTHMMKKSDNRFNVDSYIGGGRARNRARGVMAAGSAAPATARWNDTSFGCGIRLSYDVMLSDADIVTPFIGIEGLYAWQDKYTMTNGSSSLYYHDGMAARWTLPVGVTYRHIIALSKTEYIIPQMKVAFLDDIYRKDPTVKYNWTGGSGIVNGSKVGRRGVEFEAGAAWVLSSEWSTGAFYTIENRDGDCYQQVKAYASYSF